VSVTAARLRASFTLAEFAAHSQQVDGDKCSLRIRAGVAGLQGIGADRWSAVADPGVITAGSCYYTRVI
jgi:hypothetical protein